VFEHGDGRVLRRYRRPRDTRLEVAAMEHARRHGFPVPAAEAVSDTDIVMERVAGPTMLSDLTRRPWRVASQAATLAGLHRRLHEIPAPDWLDAPLGDGPSLLHLDLHPDNVILSESGPVVIDWPNAARGPGLADAAHTWVVLACSVPVTSIYMRAVSTAGRAAFTRFFLGHFERDELIPLLPDAAAYRLANRVLPAREHYLVASLLTRTGAEPVRNV
jgi:aminoglycoside phosphotransferase (APT) family kinase protein